ncbi:MAG: hypothetical protein ACO2ZM_07325 [Francisellaceae bacterium]
MRPEAPSERYKLLRYQITTHQWQELPNISTSVNPYSLKLSRDGRRLYFSISSGRYLNNEIVTDLLYVYDLDTQSISAKYLPLTSTITNKRISNIVDINELTISKDE